jgi:hypothetical protein
MDYRALLKNVEKTLSAIERKEDVLSTIASVAEAVVRNFRSELGIFGARLYIRRDEEYVLERGFGRSRKSPPGLTVRADYGPIRRAVEEGLVLTDLLDPSVDRDFEARLGVVRFAAVSFGEEKFLLSFDVLPRVPAEDLLLSLGIIRTVVDSKVRTEKLEGLINEARRIQQSILPKSVPAVGTTTSSACRSRPSSSAATSMTSSRSGSRPSARPSPTLRDTASSRPSSSATSTSASGWGSGAT